MIDLETGGLKAGCPVLAIGACSFDSSEKFYQKISLDSCLSAGLKILPETMAWWDKQDPRAREEAFSGTKDLVMVLGEFSDWFIGLQRTKGDIYIWGNGADFDLPILSAAYQAVEMKEPWKPYNGRCYRTLKNLFYDVKPDKFEGIKHTALADAEFQAAHALKILKARKANSPMRTTYTD